MKSKRRSSSNLTVDKCFEVAQLIFGVAVIAAIAFMLLTSGGCRDNADFVSIRAETCTVVSTAEGSTITCPDGSKSFVANGTAGGVGEPGLDGEDGSEGNVGPKGDQGDPGSSCGVLSSDTGATIFCDNGTSAFLPNGQDGQDGQPGTSPIIEIINPCGDGPGPDEVLLLLETGEYVAWYWQLGLTVLLENVRYTTTDGQQGSCFFSIVNGTYTE